MARTILVKACPSKENYWKNNAYDYFYGAVNAKWSDVAPIVHIDFYWGARYFMKEWETTEVCLHFVSDRAFKRCKRLYEEWYYKDLP